jgi:transcriptional regulator with XRE-family HTH domain
MRNPRFKKLFDQEYQNLLISEQIARLRHQAGLTQEALARKITTTKSAISRYERPDYQNYTLDTLRKIAGACGAHLEVHFIPDHASRDATRAG